MMKRSSIALIAVALVGTAIARGEDKKNDMHDSTPTPKHTNHLIDSLSPYLLQHAHNPVDWYPWGPEALEKAKSENKPIFLSIGYSACHWCHVMEHESFEHEDVAELLNKNFVSIKVDREERPDIDEIYMHATVSITGRGGWPMSVFLTPECVPFSAGTYYPKAQFMRLLTELATSWSESPDDLAEQAREIQAKLDAWAASGNVSQDMIPPDVCDRAATMLARYFDMEWGGMRSRSNKFPPTMVMELLLRRYQVTRNEALLKPVVITLDKMADGGIYDHLGGGICRYSTDAHWRVPHFEKMLYDQALVSSIYLDGFQVTGNKRYAGVARGIFDWVIGDLQSPEGGFYSTRDADSEGFEGKYYIWTIEQVREVLDEREAEIFCDYYDVTPRGNWFESRGHAPAGPKNVLNIKHSAEEIAKKYEISPAELEQKLAVMRSKLLEVRAKRVEPALDDKILTGWNGLMIASLAKGARVLNEPKYTEAASRAADFVLSKMRKDGRLLRTHRKGQSNLTGYLSDYAFFIDGLLNLYEATFDVKWLIEAEALTDLCSKYYFDRQAGGFFFTASDGETLIARTKNPRDGAIPSGNSIQAHNLLRLALLLDRKEFREQAESIFQVFGDAVIRNPGAYERLLCTLDFYYSKPKEIVIAAVDARSSEALIQVIYSRYLPNKVVAGVTSTGGIAVEKVPLLKGKKPIKGLPTVFVCENYACKKPVQSPAEVAALLWSVPKKK